MKAKNALASAFKYIGLIALAFFLLFPIIWMFFGTFKGNIELFSSMKLWPDKFDLSGYIDGWRATGQITYTTFYLNTFKLVIPTTLFTVLSSLIIAYGFARFEFRFKKILFAIMIGTMMLPNAVLIIPRYLIFNKLGWLDSYKVFTIPALFGCYPFFIFMFVQFFRGIPRDLDEAAKIDGCNSFRIFWNILLPLLKPAIVSGIVFQASWTWEDFFNPLIYISSTEKFPISLALRMAVDAQNLVKYSNVLAMATLSIIPCALLFFLAQKSFVEGITTSGLKG